MKPRRPVRWRYRLLATLTFLWSLFLVQAIFEVKNVDFGSAGAIFWLVVFAGLVAATLWERRRAV